MDVSGHRLHPRPRGHRRPPKSLPSTSHKRAETPLYWPALPIGSILFPGLEQADLTAGHALIKVHYTKLYFSAVKYSAVFTLRVGKGGAILPNNFMDNVLTIKTTCRDVDVGEKGNGEKRGNNRKIRRFSFALSNKV